MIRSETFDLSGRRVHLWRGGSGPPLLLLQGGMADAALHWRPVWDALAERFEVVAPDLPGFGDSQALGRPTFPALAQWLADLRGALDLAPWLAVGNSFGGTLARVLAASRGGEVDRLVLVNGGGFLPLPLVQRLLLRSPLGGRLIAERRRRGFPEALVRRMFADPDALPAGVLAACTGPAPILDILRFTMGPTRPDWLAPRQPTLVLWGEADRHVPPEAGRAIADEMPGSRFQLVPGAGHLPQLEQPQAFTSALLDFAPGAAGPVEKGEGP